MRQNMGAGLALRTLLLGSVVGLAVLVSSCMPASAGIRAGDRFFGLHAPGLHTSFPSAAAGSVNLTVNGVYWPQLEPTKGHFDFTALHALRASSRKAGAKPLLVLGQTPRYASTTPHAANVIASVPKLKLWKRYVSRVVGEFGASLDYQIWPEADIAGNWSGSPKRLAHLTAAAARIIHAKAKSAVVVSPAMVLRMRYQQAFMDTFFGVRVGGKRIGHYVDAIGIDPYPLEKGTPEDSLALIRTARSILHRHRVTAPLWNVEINYGVVSGGTSRAPHFSAGKQSAFVARTYLLNAAAGVHRVYWLLWGRYRTVSIQMAKADGTGRTAAGEAYSVVRDWMLGQHVRSCLRDRKSGIWTCTLVKAHRVSHVYWVRSGKAHVRAPHGSRHVAQVSGAVRPTHSGKRLLVTRSPLRVFH
jgi:hypothetical protein